jgi:hypothetical protein
VRTRRSSAAETPGWRFWNVLVEIVIDPPPCSP